MCHRAKQNFNCIKSLLLFLFSKLKVLQLSNCIIAYLVMKGWSQAMDMSSKRSENWALYAKSVLDRTRLALAHKSESYHHLLQPSAEYLGSLLGVEQWAVCYHQSHKKLFASLNDYGILLQVDIFTEEIIRAGSAASLSSLLNKLDPILRETANLGRLHKLSTENHNLQGCFVAFFHRLHSQIFWL